MNDPKPNFFLAGAPKCGTSALYWHIRKHPNVFMCEPKEPSYWAKKDFPIERQATVPMATLEDYLRLFKPAQPDHSVLGDASTIYFFSEHAAKDILSFSPSSKFVVCLRNPTDMVTSFHAQKVYEFQEDQKDFLKAWELQESRKNGEQLPPKCANPAMLQYREIGALRTHVSRLVNDVPDKQLHLVLFDDLNERPKEVYSELLRFLDLPDDGRQGIERANDRKSHRFPLLGKFYRHPPAIVRTPINWLRRMTRNPDSAFGQMMRGFFFAKAQKSKVPESTRQMLSETFSEDVEYLSNLLDRDLAHWHTRKAEPAATS